MKRLIITLCLALGSFVVGCSDDFQRGVEAYNKGDYATALKEWIPLANLGNVKAQYNLGLMYDMGKGVLQDYEEAVRWYKLSAEQGYSSAQHNLGLLNFNGQGVPQDFQTAINWFTLAAEQGSLQGQHNIAYMYYNGQGVKIDKIYAYMWASIASSNGFENSKVILEALSKEMTPSQIQEAQRLTEECLKKNYKGC